MRKIEAEDRNDENSGLPPRVGISLKADIDLFRDGARESLPGGEQIWRVSVTADKALALGLYFDDFFLPEGYRMFIYSDSDPHILGAYTLFNNKENRLFSTELIYGDHLVIEIGAAPGSDQLPSCHISEVSYVYRDLPDFVKNRGVSDDCEVNINCPEGENWQFQKHGVARIYVKNNVGFYWCTGALLNNALQDNEPFFLTADHCAPDVTAGDLAQWVFYFNYEAPGCENPTVNPIPNSMTGAVKLASADTNGSDFLLIRLADDVPENYEPYYNGWSNENIASTSGVVIHHPAGDIKKISTYTTPIQSTQWSSVPGTHWLVYWTETESGWGVTEGGSSGSPLFNNNGRIIGALTGGQAACEPNGSGAGTGPDKPDYFGKFSYSWDQNGNDPSEQLKYWLDPDNSGITSLPGKYSRLTAAFEASPTLLLAGNTVDYTNLSSGLPVTWEWTFDGGVPSTFSGAEPGSVMYPDAGQFDVSLVVSDGNSHDTLHLTNYIHVVGKVYPNPTSDKVNIFIEEELPAAVKVSVFNILGQKLFEEEYPEQVSPLISVDVSQLSIGIYTVRLEIKQRYVFARVFVNR